MKLWLKAEAWFHALYIAAITHIIKLTNPKLEERFQTILLKRKILLFGDLNFKMLNRKKNTVY